MTEALIRDVSDTSFWIAHHRAQETARHDALFRDTLAARLAGERGGKIAAAMPNSQAMPLLLGNGGVRLDLWERRIRDGQIPNFFGRSHA